MRYKLTIEYDGRGYYGWQEQPSLPTVQSAIESAISRVVESPIKLCVAGRTDTGVHALGQVADFLSPKPLPAWVMFRAINSHLRGHAISILNVEHVSDDFNSRFSALQRSYVYQIINRYAPLTIDNGRAWRIGQALDLDLMNQAASLLLGTHDFTTFRSTECQASSPIRTIDECYFTQANDRITFHISARSFLHHQVRNIIGTLHLVGRKKWPIERFYSALLAKDRRSAGPTAPPDGLYLVRVRY